MLSARSSSTREGSCTNTTVHSCYAIPNFLFCLSRLGAQHKCGSHNQPYIYPHKNLCCSSYLYSRTRQYTSKMQTAVECRDAWTSFFCCFGTMRSSVAAAAWNFMQVNVPLGEGRTQDASSACINSCKANSSIS